MLTPVPTTMNHKPYANEIKTHFLSQLEDCVVLRNILVLENDISTCDAGRNLVDEINYMV